MAKLILLINMVMIIMMNMMTRTILSTEIIRFTNTGVYSRSELSTY